jgi:carboxyl-terminal processing protease
METLKKVMQFEGYYDEAKEEFERLQKKLTHDPGHDLDLHKDLVKQVLASEIVAAYYYQKGVIQNTIRSDKQIKEAYRLLLDNEEYRRILSPKQ